VKIRSSSPLLEVLMLDATLGNLEVLVPYQKFWYLQQWLELSWTFAYSSPLNQTVILNYFLGRHRAQLRFNFILCFEIEYRKAILTRGTHLLVHPSTK
jgi:hypothetical protein